MSDQNRILENNLGGLVNVVTEDRIVFQGRIVDSNNCSRTRKLFQPSFANGLLNNGFIFLELRCEPSIIRDNAQLQTINPPLYEIGDIIRIRVADIIAVGPGTTICVNNTET